MTNCLTAHQLVFLLMLACLFGSIVGFLAATAMARAWQEDLLRLARMEASAERLPELRHERASAWLR